MVSGAKKMRVRMPGTSAMRAEVEASSKAQTNADRLHQTAHICERCVDCAGDYVV